MTDCNTNPLLFASLGRKKIQADFNGGSLTSDAGALLLREVDRRISIIDAINNCIPDPRNPFYTVHQQRTMLAQRIFAIALEYEDLPVYQSDFHILLLMSIATEPIVRKYTKVQ